MGLLAWGFPGGRIGAALMDVTENGAARFGIASGVNVARVGRWLLGLGLFDYWTTDSLMQKSASWDSTRWTSRLAAVTPP